MKVEHKCVFVYGAFSVDTTSRTGSGDSVQSTVTQYGNDGWELVSFQIVFNQRMDSGTNLIFKRKK